MYVAIYTASGRMVYFGQDNKEINAGDSADFRVQIDMPENVGGRFASEGYYANVFVWDSETFVPVMQKHVFPE